MTNDKFDGGHEIVGLLSGGVSGLVTVRVRSDDGRTQDYVILPELILKLKIGKGRLSESEHHLILISDKFSRAVVKGVAMLSRSNKSSRALERKLTEKGVDRNIAEQAVTYLGMKGYVDDERTACTVALNCAEKLWGLNRIVSKLYADGYDDQAVKAAIESLSEYDFVSSCEKLIRKKYKTIPTETGAVFKMRNSLKNYGYRSVEIATAIGRLKE